MLKKLNTFEKKAVWMLVVAFILTAGFYSYFVKATIQYVVEHQRALASAEELHASVGALEFRYGVLQKKITPEYAKQLGFSESPLKTFATRERLVQN